MKVRIKCNKVSKTVDVGNGDSSSILLSTLRQQIIDEGIVSTSPVLLSLNGKDLLEGEDKTLSSFGIVHGDILYVLNSDGDHQVSHQASPHFQNLAVSPKVVSGEDGDSPQIKKEKCEEIATCVKANRNQNYNETKDVDDDTAGQNKEIPSSSPCSSHVQDTENRENRRDVAPSPMDSTVLRCLSEPQLCRESTSRIIPAQLHQLLQSVNCHSGKDALWVVLCVLLKEAGFESIEIKESQDEQNALPLNNTWNKGPFYRLQLLHPMAEGLVCTVIGMTLPSSLVVYGSLSEPMFQTQHLQLKPADYVNDYKSTTASCYKNLEKLSRIFKDGVCSSLLLEMESVLGLPPQHGILSLPNEMRLKLMSYLPAHGIVSLGQTCRSFQSSYKDQTLWRRRYLLDFGKRENMSLSQNWYMFYRRETTARRDKKMMMQMLRRQDTAHYIIPAPLNPSGLLGGDYDLDPLFPGVGEPSGLLPRPGQNFPHPGLPFRHPNAGPRLPMFGPPHRPNPLNPFHNRPPGPHFL